jgi:hypothetical protein
MNIRQLTFGFVLLLLGQNLFGQIDLQFTYEYSDDFKKPVYSKIKIQSPNENIETLYADTIRLFETTKQSYLQYPGDYILKVSFSDFCSLIDSVEYRFTINGTETDVFVNIGFYLDFKLVRENNQWIKKEIVPQGHISVTKHFKASESIQIKWEDIQSDDYKGPFFKITNNSKDTLYGEFLPGYFWGTLSMSINDSTWSRKNIGTIDMEFVDSPPLLPDSSKIATVGSFGLLKILPKCYYTYEVFLSKKPFNFGLSKYLDKNVEWWANTKELYRLRYKFKIE